MNGITKAIRIMVIISASLGWSSCLNQQGKYTGTVESISVGMESTSVNSLIYIAEEQKYFASNGLNVTIRDYPSGLAAVGGLLNNEVEIATAAEFVIVGKALTNESIRTFGSIDKFLHNYLLGRGDKGIKNVADLEGRRIGVPLKTAAEFYLGRFLDLHGMNIKRVTLVDLSPLQLVDALAKGDVDAVIAWQPNARNIEGLLGDKIVRWPAQNGQASYCAAIATNSWAASHPELIDRFLKSLVQAESYLTASPAEAKAIIQDRLKYDDSYMSTIWPEHQLSVSLDQSLVLAMEDEARWMIQNNLTSEKTVPDFLNYVYLDGLKAVKPEAVNITR